MGFVSLMRQGLSVGTWAALREEKWVGGGSVLGIERGVVLVATR